MYTKIGGGSTDTEVDELTVTPRGAASRSYVTTVTTVTPVMSCPTLWRRWRASTGSRVASRRRVSRDALTSKTEDAVTDSDVRNQRA
jgi:hypothetical protein